MSVFRVVHCDTEVPKRAWVLGIGIKTVEVSKPKRESETRKWLLFTLHASLVSSNRKFDMSIYWSRERDNRSTVSIRSFNLSLSLSLSLWNIIVFNRLLLGFAFPLMWYYATFLYFGNYYQKDPRERAGLAAAAIAVSLIVSQTLVLIESPTTKTHLDKFTKHTHAYTILLC